jgi:hypothetical protein
MRTTTLLLLIFVAAMAAFGQEKPIAQAEYVQMLYGIERQAGTTQEVIDSLRRRGIEFTLTDGLRSLTRTKSRNHAELRAALEEADRRRRNPEAAIPTPSADEAREIIERTRQNTLEAVAEMPDFVVKQQIQRSAAYAGTGNFRNLDRLLVAVSYRSSGQEEYRLLSVNGIARNDPESKSSYEEAGGSSSTGEFVTMLATIFKRENEARFDPVFTDTVRGRRAMMFDFEVARDKAMQRVTSASKTYADTAITGMKGRLWIDLDHHRVLRVESHATELPDSFPITSAKRTIDYDWATISEESYLLPSLSDVRLTFRDRSRELESRNVIRFRDYQKYGTEVIILEADDEPIVEDQPQR